MVTVQCFRLGGSVAHPLIGRYVLRGNMELITDDKYTIHLPIIRQQLGKDGLLEITTTSPREQRDALEQLALYFKREFSYTGIQYCANETGVDSVEYLGFAFVEPAYGHMAEEDPGYPTRLLGGGCFRKRGEHWFLDWVWIHPYARNKGLFSRQIPYFKSKLGQFLPEMPVSDPMKHIFLTKVRT